MRGLASRKSWYILFLLVLAYVSSFIDRNIINFFVTPIKRDLGLTDTEVGLLQGFAFSIFYITAGLFVGRLADAYSRRNLIAIGLIVWSLSTISCGLAGGFLALFLCRMFVGVGESTLSPSATSLLTDLFPKERLSLAMGIYATAPYIGSGLAMMIGGWLLDSFGDQGQIHIPLLGLFTEWQVAFLLVGPPGLVLALLMMTFREPERQEATPTLVLGDRPSLKAFAQYVFENRTTYAFLFTGSAMLSLVGYGVTSWLPTYYLREFSAPSSNVGNLLGTSLLIGGPCGVLIGGWVGDRLRTRRGDATTLLALIGAAGTLLVTSLVVLVESWTLSILLVIPLYIFKVLPVGPLYASVNLMTPNRMRAQIFALLLFFDGIIGAAFGPLSIGFVTDFVLGDEQKLGLSILIVVTVAMAISLCCFWRVHGSDLNTTRHWQPAM